MNDNINTLELIIKHGLTIRQIPEVVISLLSLPFNPEYKLKDNQILVEENGRKLIKETRIPENAGMWMAKKCENTDSMVRWNIKTDNLSNTLDEAVLKAISKKD